MGEKAKFEQVTAVANAKKKKKKIKKTYSKSHTSSCSNKTSKKDSSDLGTSSKTIQGSI